MRGPQIAYGAGNNETFRTLREPASAPMSIMGGTLGRRQLHICTYARSGECRRHFGWCRSASTCDPCTDRCDWVGRDRGRREASATQQRYHAAEQHAMRCWAEKAGTSAL